MKEKNKLIIIFASVVFVFLFSIIAIGYAWFNATVETAGPNSVVVNAARLGRLIFYNGEEINVSGVYPGWCETKRVSIESVESTTVSGYNIVLNVVRNDFVDYGLSSGFITVESSVVVASTQVDAGTVGTGGKQNITVSSGEVQILTGILGPEEIHTYDILFCFPEFGSNQNSQQGKVFNGYITITSTSTKFNIVSLETSVGTIMGTPKRIVEDNETVEFRVKDAPGYENPSVSCTGGSLCSIDLDDDTALLDKKSSIKRLSALAESNENYYIVTVSNVVTDTTATVIWDPKVLNITLNNQSATSAGTTTIYEKYNTGYYLNSGATTQMTTSSNAITVPTRQCYTFGGYYTGTNGSGTQYIDENGNLTSGASTTNFTAAGTLYAKWIATSTVYVSSSGNDSTNVGTDTSNPFATINKAYTCPGVSNSLTINLLSNITQTSTINFNTASKTVNLKSNTTSTIYKITRGSSLTDFIISLSNGGTLTTSYINIDGNNVNAKKSAINVTGSSTLNLNTSTTVQRNRINTVDTKTDFAGGGVRVADSSTLNITGATITANKLVTAPADIEDTHLRGGGGIYMGTGTTLVFNSGTISNNTSSSPGGGIRFARASSISIKGGTISGNSSTDNGGGMSIYTAVSYSTTGSITGGTISGNSAGAYGGGISSICSGTTGNISLNITSATIRNNTASNYGGGIYFGGQDDITPTLTLNGATISGNTSSSTGGGVMLRYSTLTMKGTTSITSNKGTNGGGVGVGVGSTFNLQKGTISSNSCTNTSCNGGVYVNSSSTYNKTGGTVSGNTPNN